VNLLGKNISANLLSNIWLTALVLSLTPLYIWLLGVESYGLIGFYLSWISILAILDTGVSATAVREIAWRSARPETKGTIPALLRSLEVTYWGIILVLGVGILAGAWFFGAGWFQAKTLQPDVIRDALMLMAVSLVFQVPSGLYVGGLMGLQRQVECSGLLAIFGTLRGLGSVMVLLFISSDIQTFFLWQIVASVLQTGVMRWSLWRRVFMDGHPARFSAEMLLTLKGYVGAIILISVLGVILSQADKMILSRMSSLEEFGFYMLAWALASGLSRAATPVIQAFSPQFTELVSRGDEESLARQVRIASQLMSVLIIPPAALIVFLSKPILLVWLGSEITAEGTAPILAVMVIGTMFASCSFPSVTILYSKKQLLPVVALNLICLIVLLPLLIVAIVYFSIMGAAYIWGLYGLILYIAHQVIGLRGLPNTRIFPFMLRNFIVPCVVSFFIAGIAGYWLSEVNGKITFVFFFILTLLVSWFAALLACEDLRKIVMGKWKWNTKTVL
jgi:O-antigen/teichoic acid export membrane protein